MFNRGSIHAAKMRRIYKYRGSALCLREQRSESSALAWLPLKQAFYACGAAVGDQKRFGLWLPLKQAFYASMSGDAFGDVWSMACSLPPTIIFIIMFSSMCRTSRMRVGLRDLVQLNPEGEIHRNSSVVAYDLDVFGRLALLPPCGDGR